MKAEQVLKELSEMQDDLREMRAFISKALTRHNYIMHRVNQTKRKINAQIRKEKDVAQSKPQVSDERQSSLKFD